MTHTTSLELSKRLWDLGLKLDTEKWWFKTIDKGWGVYNRLGWALFEEAEKYPAPSTDELLEVMPEEIEYQGHTCRLSIGKNDKWYAVWYDSTDMLEINSAWTRLTANEENEESLCEALGKMVLYLLENAYHYDKEKGGLVR
jgi:hypothetical protein